MTTTVESVETQVERALTGQPNTLRTKEVAALMGCSRQTVLRSVVRGELTPLPVSPFLLRVDEYSFARDEVARYLRERLMATGAQAS